MTESAMRRDNDFVNYILDQLAFIRGLHARAMFGGHGLYQDEIIFAIIVNDMLYLKANDETKPDFEVRGLSPFSYAARGRTMTIQYYEAPADVFEDADSMRYWTDKALQAALRSKSRNSGKTRP